MHSAQSDKALIGLSCLLPIPNSKSSFLALQNVTIFGVFKEGIQLKWGHKVGSNPTLLASVQEEEIIGGWEGGDVKAQGEDALLTVQLELEFPTSKL